MIKDRNGEIVVTNEKQNILLKKLYGTVCGRVILKALTAPAVSKAAGVFMDSRLSVPLIKRFIKSSGIDTSQYVMKKFRSYNEFFTRRVKRGMRPIDRMPSHFISPCDSKLTVYKIGKSSVFRIKGSRYRVSDLIQNDFLAKRYEGGYCMIFRLEVDDYHRYCYIDSGTKTENTFINGELHTVNPIALEHYNIYKRNCREYTVLHTENFGDVVQVEVGAMMKTKSIIDDSGVPVRKFLILSSSRTLATVSPTRLDSKYFSGNANRCLNSLKLSITSIRLVV